MTSVGVISSAVARIKRLKELQEVPFDDHGVLEHLKDIKDLLLTAYDRRREEAAEAEIKKVVRLSYEIVDNFVLDSFKAVKTGTKKLKEPVEKLTDVKGELTRKILPEASAPSGITAASTEAESSTASPRSAKAALENITKRSGFRINTGSGTLGKIKNFITTKNEKSTSDSDSDQPVVSKAPSLERSTTNSESQVEEPEIGTSGSSEIQIQEGEDKINLLGRIKQDLISELPKGRPREVYIVGESGMGKTTLARKLYNDVDIQNKFQVSGWVTVGHNFQVKGVLQLILQQLQGGLRGQQAELKQMNEMELIVQIFSVVKDKSYLLVLQDVGSIKDWENICLALPLANSTRVIITTSAHEFLSCATKYKLASLTESQTLALLNKQATIFGAKIGKAIHDITGGSPLYTRILGRSLESEANDPDQLVGELVSYKSKKGTPQLLDASYRRLAPELKPCFLYMGMFPPAQHIRVHKLYLLLSAENLILSPTGSQISLPESFKKCMDKLAGLKLVKVVEDELVSRTGFHKSCVLHDQVQDYCKSKGFGEEFIEVVDFKSSEQVVGPETRRLAVYMRNYRGEGSVSFKLDAGVKNKMLSLLVFDVFGWGQEKSEWPSEISDLSGFTHLRVLNFEEVSFRVRKLPKGIEKMTLLRFLSLRGCFLEELPSYLSSLTQLETLDLLVQDDCCVIIPTNIFTAMKRMVHLFLPRKYEGKGKTMKVSLRGLEMMETLINFDTEVFDVKDLCQLKKLEILSTISNGDYPEHVNAVIDLLKERGDAGLRHSSMEIRNFDCYNRASISALKELLLCKFVDSVQIEGQIEELPEEESGGGSGGRVREMILHGSELEDDPMGYFGRFQNLRSLVLADDAFMGTKILISSSPMFPKLRSLKLRNLQYLEKLTIEEGAVPELSSLQIESCGDALELTIPEKLHKRLKNSTRDDAYTVVPSPSKFNITTTP